MNYSKAILRPFITNDNYAHVLESPVSTQKQPVINADAIRRNAPAKWYELDQIADAVTEVSHENNQEVA